MNSKAVLLPLLFLVPALWLSAFAMPELTITRTYLMRDIEPSTMTVAAGTELFREDTEAYLGDFLFGYVGYAPKDWVEIGVAFHSWLFPYPSLEATFDLVDVFTDSSRLSLLLMGGISPLIADGQFYLFYHGGAALSYRVGAATQLYLGVGSDLLSKALNLQVGAYFRLLEWLGASTNFKLVVGSEGIEPMLSIAPMVVIRPCPKSGD
jgi:hypothetical protein